MFVRAMAGKEIRVEVLSRKEVDRLGVLIRKIIEGRKNEARGEVVQMATRLKERGVDGLILGCTEIPLVFPKNFGLPVVDSLEVLAKELVKRYYQDKERL